MKKRLLNDGLKFHPLDVALTFSLHTHVKTLAIFDKLVQDT